MKTIIDKISNVTGGWHHGFSVDVSLHHEADGKRDGFETARVSLDRDRLIKDDGTEDAEAITAMVKEHVSAMFPGEAVEEGRA